MSDENGWGEWKNVIKKHMEHTNLTLDTIQKEQVRARIDIATLQVKSGVWGFLAGCVPTVGMLLFLLVKDKM